MKKTLHIMIFTFLTSTVLFANELYLRASNEDDKRISEPEVQTNQFESEVKPTMEDSIIQKGGFIDSILRISLLGGLSIADWGDMYGKENDAKDQYINQVTTYPVYGEDGDYFNYRKYFIGPEICVMIPAFKFQQKRRFGISGIKFGIICNYLFYKEEETYHDLSLPHDDYSGILLRYRTLNAGAEMNIIFSPKSNIVNMILRFNMLYGFIHHGDLTALPALRDAHLSIDKSQYSTGFTGNSLSYGGGIYFVLNRGFHLITGFDLQYTDSKIKFNHSLPVYHGAGSTSFQDVGINMSVGVFF